MASSENIAIVILAAGASSRMGSTKQLLPWEDTTLLGKAIRTAIDCDADAVVVILGANAESIRSGVKEDFGGKPDVDFVENTAWETGLGSSIACGIEFILKKEIVYDGILIMLADQPLIDSDYLNLMVSAFCSGDKAIVATSYKNRAGVPALFSASYYQKLTELDDDFGAKKIIDDPGSDIQVLDPKHKTEDIDTKSDYETLIKKSNNTE